MSNPISDHFHLKYRFKGGSNVRLCDASCVSLDGGSSKGSLPTWITTGACLSIRAICRWSAVLINRLIPGIGARYDKPGRNRN